ncbi:MAG TPA: hypothetical protein PK745_13255, partial [bacterium]|nr:hypothetical protein [bacterium]
RGNHFFAKNRFPRAPSEKTLNKPVLLNFVLGKTGIIFIREKHPESFSEVANPSLGFGSDCSERMKYEAQAHF